MKSTICHFHYSFISLINSGRTFISPFSPIYNNKQCYCSISWFPEKLTAKKKCFLEDFVLWWAEKVLCRDTENPYLSTTPFRIEWSHISIGRLSYQNWYKYPSLGDFALQQNVLFSFAKKLNTENKPIFRLNTDKKHWETEIRKIWITNFYFIYLFIQGQIFKGSY